MYLRRETEKQRNAGQESVFDVRVAHVRRPPFHESLYFRSHVGRVAMSGLNTPCGVQEKKIEKSNDVRETVYGDHHS
jgi:hypothetical protein